MQKNGERMLCMVVPRLGIMRKKCYFTNLPTMIFAVDSSAEYVGAYNAPRHPPSI